MKICKGILYSNGIPIRFVLMFLAFLFISSSLFAQSEFPAGDFWSLDGGLGMSGILVKGQSYQFIVDPKLWLSPKLMVGSKVGVNYSTESKSESSSLSNILTFEGQVYLRWNFLNLGKNPQKLVDIFFQGGLGMLSAYRGDKKPFDDSTVTRGSLMADAAIGVTIPLTPRWHLEPQIRGGYPHIWGGSLTAGYKFPLPQKTGTQDVVKTQDFTRTEYVAIMRRLPPNEILKHIRIFSIEFILFGPDIGKYNIGIDNDAQQLNELVLGSTAKMLSENPNYRVRIEGHANPYTISHSEADELMTLSAIRANTIADQLRERGVSDDQMVVITFGGTRTATSDFDVRNRNRRVELIIVEFNED